LKNKYGWFSSFIFLEIVMLHSSVTLSEAKEILSSPEVGFDKKNVQEMGIILKLDMIK